MITKIISGGQTGVDQGALDFALAMALDCGGWCPSGRLSENGPIPAKYPVKEGYSTHYEIRTEMNIIDSDGTLILCLDNNLKGGTKLTQELCSIHQRPLLILHLNENPMLARSFLADWINKRNIKVLNVAGSRESSFIGIQAMTQSFCQEIFEGLTCME